MISADNQVDVRPSWSTHSAGRRPKVARSVVLRAHFNHLMRIFICIVIAATMASGNNWALKWKKGLIKSWNCCLDNFGFKMSTKSQRITQWTTRYVSNEELSQVWSFGIVPVGRFPIRSGSGDFYFKLLSATGVPSQSNPLTLPDNQKFTKRSNSDYDILRMGYEGWGVSRLLRRYVPRTS